MLEQNFQNESELKWQYFPVTNNQLIQTSSRGSINVVVMVVVIIII